MGENLEFLNLTTKFLDLKDKIRRMQDYSLDSGLLKDSIQLTIYEIESRIINATELYAQQVFEKESLLREIKTLLKQLSNGEWINKTNNLLPKLQAQWAAIVNEKK